jgi:hypothetical protein
MIITSKSTEPRMASVEQVKRHVNIAQIVQALLEGQPCSEVASRFGLAEADLEAYAQEAMLTLAGPGQPEVLAEDPSTGELELDEDDAGTLEDTPLEAGDQAEQPRKDPESYQEERYDGLQKLRDAVEAERRSYEQQPRPFLTLCSDPGFRIGWQPARRLSVLIQRERREKQERLNAFRRDPFNWNREPPRGW